MYKTLLIVLFLISAASINSQVMFVADLNGEQEVPSVTTDAKATGFFVFRPDSNYITYRITYAKLQGTFTGAHFHIGTAGTAGPVVQPITFNQNTASTTWRNVPDSVMAKLMTEDVYVNIHSSAFPGGEIRGQLRRVNGIGMASSMFSGQEVPPVTSPAQGTAYAILINNGSQIKYGATVANLTSAITGAHFHFGAFGTNGPVVVPVSFTDSSANGTIISFPDTMITHFIRNRVYLNVHTTNNPGGEIRGQMYRQGEIMFSVSLNSQQVIPPVTSNAKGTGWVVMTKNLAGFNYSYTYAGLAGSFTNAYFRKAGAVSDYTIDAIPFNGNHASGTKSYIADSLFRYMIKGEVYVVIRSSAHPTGEIRGTMKLIDGFGFTSELSGMNEVPPVTTNASGTGWMVLGSSTGGESDSARYEFTIANLSAPLTGAHFHRGSRVVSGPVVMPISFADSTAMGSWSINDSTALDLMRANIYANVHSGNFPGGEIRGPMFFAGVASGEISSVEEEYIGTPNGYSLQQNFPNPFNPVTKIRYSVPTDGIVKLKVYNLIGEEIAVLVNQSVKAGMYELNWNASHVPSGVYFYRIETGDFTSVKKMVLLK